MKSHPIILTILNLLILFTLNDGFWNDKDIQLGHIYPYYQPYVFAFSLIFIFSTWLLLFKIIESESIVNFCINFTYSFLTPLFVYSFIYLLFLQNSSFNYVITPMDSYVFMAFMILSISAKYFQLSKNNTSISLAFIVSLFIVEIFLLIKMNLTFVLLL